MSNHISETEYAQLSDTDKAGYREQKEIFVTIEQKWVVPNLFIESDFDQLGFKTRLVYIPIHLFNDKQIGEAWKELEKADFIKPFEYNPTPDREPEEKNNGWISVKDKLPNPISHVLIWTNISIDATLAYYINKDWLYFSNHENFWLKHQPHIEVLHWQPLPSPPNI